MRLKLLHPFLDVIANHITERTSVDMQHDFFFEPTAIIFNTDTSRTRIAPGIFTIERLADTPSQENMYFSSAPLRTSEHIDLIKRFESSLLQSEPSL